MYLLTIHVLRLSQNIVNLYGCYLNDFKLFIMVTYTIFQVHVMYVTFKIALNIKLMSLTSPVDTYLHACTGLCTSFNKVYLFLSIHLINALSCNCYVCYQMIHKLI